MNLEIILVNVIGAALIFLIWYWFFGMKPNTKKLKIKDDVNVLVKDGVYSPALIKASAGKSLALHFTREDAAPCAEVVVFPALNLSAPLPLHATIDVIIAPQPASVVEFTCQMGMYRGKIIFE